MKFITILIILFSILYLVQSQQCEALILSDGSDYGYYSVGAIQNLIQNGSVNWDVYSGVGTSAITAAVLNGFDKSQQSEVSEYLQTFWEGLRQDHVSKTYEGGMIYGQVYEKGFMAYEPLRHYLQSNLKPQLGALNFGSTDIDSGEFVRYSEKIYQNDGEQQFLNALMSAMSIPAYFPWRNFENKNVFSGGVSQPLDLVGALDRCMEIVNDESQITFDIVSITSQALLGEWGASQKKKPFQVLRKTTLIRSYRKLYEQLSEFFSSHPKITCRYYVEPSTQLYESQWPFYFELDDIQRQIQVGQQDGEASIEAGSGQKCSQIQKQALLQSLKEIDPEFENISDEELELLLKYE